MDNNLMRAAGGADVSSYPSRAGVTQLAPPPNPIQGASQSLQLMQQIQNLDSTKFDAMTKQHSAMAGAFSSIVTDPSLENISARAGELKRQGVSSDAIAAGVAEFAKAGNDPKAIQQIALRHLSQIASVQERLQMGGKAAPQLHDNGNNFLPIAAGSGLNQGILPAPGPAIPKQLGPVERITRIDTTNPDGSKTAVPVGSVFNNSGYLPGTVPGGAGQGVPMQQKAPDGTVRRTLAPAPPPLGSKGAEGQPPGPVGFNTGNAPADTADQAAQAQAFIDARNDVQPSRDRATTMKLALDAVRGTNVGLGTANRQKMLNFINSLPNGWGKMLVPDGAELSDFEVSRKYLAAATANSQGAGRSDAALAISAGSNPNTDMTKGALTETAVTNIGRERMRQAQVLDHLASGKSPAEFSNRITKEWDQYGDPKAYALPAMTPDERSALVTKMKPDDKKRFFTSVRKGLETGVLSRKDLAGVSAAPAPAPPSGGR